MAIVLAGGTGFLGRALAARLGRRHEVRILTRKARAGHDEDVEWRPDGSTGPWCRVLDAAHAVVNLAGENLASGRWSAARKTALRDSRLRATDSLVAGIRATAVRPRVFVSASAVGYYGPRGEECLDEQAPPGEGFLADLCVDWENAARDARDDTSVAIIRSGAVMHPSDGALKKMLLPFRLGVGGPVASGGQYLSWIHRDDWIRLVEWIVDTGNHGTFNVTSPEPVTNRAFTRALGRALRRPAIVPVPGAALRAMYGEMATTVTTGQRVVPAHAASRGFIFRFPTVDAALADLLSGNAPQD